MEPPPEWLPKEAKRTASPLVRIRPEKEERPFFCVHPVGGAVFCYADLVRALGPGRLFYGLQSSGMHKGETIFTRIEDMAAYYIESLRSVQKEGPYHIGGWSMGGMAAFEMARRLREAGQETAALIMIDSYAPVPLSGPGADELYVMLKDLENFLGEPIPLKSYELKGLDEEARVEYALKKVLASGAMPPGADLAGMKRFYNVLKANCGAMEKYSPGHYPGATAFFSSADKDIAPEDPALGWSEFLSIENLTIKQIPGDHYTMLRPPHVSLLAGEMDRFLARG